VIVHSKSYAEDHMTASQLACVKDAFVVETWFTAADSNACVYFYIGFKNQFRMLTHRDIKMD